jgi:hypothetical protein
LSDAIQTELRARPNVEPTRHPTQKELADRWNVSPRTLERWRWLGRPPACLKIGGRVAYRMKDVLAFEAAQLRAPADSNDPFFRNLR